MGCPTVAVPESQNHLSPLHADAAGSSQASLTIVSPSISAEPHVSDGGFANISGLEHGVMQELRKLHTQGIQVDTATEARRYRLTYGGGVPNDGNCLFTSVSVAVGGGISPRDLRAAAVRRFTLEASKYRLWPDAQQVDQVISHLYSPDVTQGWGVHFIQEKKLLLRVSDQQAVTSELAGLQASGLSYLQAAGYVYQDIAIAVRDRETWAQYMSVDGSNSCAHLVVSLQYIEDGLFAADVSSTASFGDDLAIECLAQELQRDIYVVQAHGEDAGCGSGALFFLPHLCRTADQGAFSQDPIFLLMKGGGWSGAGGDHYEPLLATRVVDWPSQLPPALKL